MKESSRDGVGCIHNVNFLCNVDLQGVHTTAQGFVTRNKAVRLNLFTDTCWLAAAIESLRQENQEAFRRVVLANYNKLEFRWGFQYFTLLNMFKFLIHLINPNQFSSVLANFLYFQMKAMCLVPLYLFL